MIASNTEAERRQALEETIALHQMNVLSECMTEIRGELTFQDGASLPSR